MQIYSVRISMDSERYTRHRSLNVIAVDLMDAAEFVREEYPDAHIWTIAHKGALDVNHVSFRAFVDIELAARTPALGKP